MLSTWFAASSVGDRGFVTVSNHRNDNDKYWIECVRKKKNRNKMEKMRMKKLWHDYVMWSVFYASHAIHHNGTYKYALVIMCNCLDEFFFRVCRKNKGKVMVNTINYMSREFVQNFQEIVTKSVSGVEIDGVLFKWYITAELIGITCTLYMSDSNKITSILKNYIDKVSVYVSMMINDKYIEDSKTSYEDLLNCGSWLIKEMLT